MRSASELVRAREAAHAGGEVRVGRAALQHLAEQRHDLVEPQPVERREEPGRRRDLEDPEPPAGLQHPAELGQRRRQVGDVAHAEADRGRVELRIRERHGHDVPLQPSNSLLLGAGAVEHPGREVEADDLARPGFQRRHGQVAGAAAGVEDAVARPDDRLDRLAAPVLVEADGHDAVHHVVDRRDPVEHRPHLGAASSLPVSTLTRPAPNAESARARARAGRASARR